MSRLFYRKDAETIEAVEARRKVIQAADRQVNRRTLRPLKDLGLVRVVRPFARAESGRLSAKEVSVLTRAGADTVRQIYAEQGRSDALRWQRSWLEIDGTNQAHAAVISDFYVALRRATEGDWRLRGWRDDRDLAQLVQFGMVELGGLIPDAVFVLQRGDHLYPLFLEIDLGTESIASARHISKDVTAKFERYRTYLAGQWRIDPLFDGITTQPRVMFLTTSTRRLDSVAEAIERLGLDDSVLLGEVSWLERDLAPMALLCDRIWRRISDRSLINLLDVLGDEKEPLPADRVKTTLTDESDSDCS